MPRKKNIIIKINNQDNLQSVVQETYKDACLNLLDAQRIVNVLNTATKPQDTDDYTKIAKAKTDALKIKDSAIKIKLEIAKLQNSIIQHNGNEDAAIKETTGDYSSLKDDFSKIRDIIKNKANSED